MRQASADACCLLRMTTYAWMIRLNAAAVLASRHVPAAEHQGMQVGEPQKHDTGAMMIRASSFQLLLLTADCCMIHRTEDST
jgi:hypothetical protein